MNREVHVRFWEGVGVKSSRATQLSCTTATVSLQDHPRLAAGDLAYYVLNRRVGRLPLFEDQKMVALFSPHALASRAALHFPFDQAIQAAYE